MCDTGLLDCHLTDGGLGCTNPTLWTQITSQRPYALIPSDWGLNFNMFSLGGAHGWLAFIVMEGTVQAAGEKGHPWYYTALTPEFCNTNLPSKMCSPVQDGCEVQYWSCHSWSVLEACFCGQGILSFQFSLITASSIACLLI